MSDMDALACQYGDWIKDIRGKLVPHQLLSELTWFRVGGPVDLFFMPVDEDDLSVFLSQLDPAIQVTTIGLGSNLLIRDGGLDGVVIRLGRGFKNIHTLKDYQIEVGAGVPDVKAAMAAADASIDGLTFYRGIPGGIGGALYMNAGCYGTQTKDRVIRLKGVHRNGEKFEIDAQQMGYRYRQSNGPEGAIFTSAIYQGFKGDKAELYSKMAQITQTREASQPTKSRTGGSTFKNPQGYSSWKLIDQAGCRGLQIGHAQVSEKHCNFLINLGEATALDIETLGETVRQKVRAHHGIELRWEIRRMGQFLNSQQVGEFIDGPVFTGKV